MRFQTAVNSAGEEHAVMEVGGFNSLQASSQLNDKLTLFCSFKTTHAFLRTEAIKEVGNIGSFFFSAATL